jgi:hypothetical protein
MMMGDFISLAQLRLPVKVVVFNNGALGFIELEQKSTGFLDFEALRSRYSRHLAMKEIGCQRRQSIVVALRPAIRGGELSPSL